MNAKKNIWITIIFVLVSGVSIAQNNLQGGLNSSVDLNIPLGDYEALINPENSLGLQDASLRNEAYLKFDTSGDVASVELRFDFKEYPIADVILNTAAMFGQIEPTLNAALPGIADLVYMSGETLWTADLTRANVSWYPKSWLNITIGRQSFLTGYGYGWNPLDLANPIKNPADPKAVLKGVDGISVGFIPAWWMNLRMYALLPGAGEDYEDVCAGGELTLILPAVEIKLSGLYGGNEESLQDIHHHAAALAFYADIQGLGFYGEGAVRSKSRRAKVTDTLGSVEESNGPVFSALAGLEYVLPSGVTLIAEYFYNGEGWSNSTMKNYEQTLANPLNLNGVLYSLYTPLYFAEHYVMLNVLLPFYSNESELNASLIFSPDSGVLYIVPSFRVNLDENLAFDISYFGGFDLYATSYNELALAPVSHTVSFSLSYIF